VTREPMFPVAPVMRCLISVIAPAAQDLEGDALLPREGEVEAVVHQQVSRRRRAQDREEVDGRTDELAHRARDVRDVLVAEAYAEARQAPVRCHPVFVYRGRSDPKTARLRLVR